MEITLTNSTANHYYLLMQQPILYKDWLEAVQFYKGCLSDPEIDRSDLKKFRDAIFDAYITDLTIIGKQEEYADIRDKINLLDSNLARK